MLAARAYELPFRETALRHAEHHDYGLRGDMFDHGLIASAGKLRGQRGADHRQQAPEAIIRDVTGKLTGTVVTESAASHSTQKAFKSWYPVQQVRSDDWQCQLLQ